MIVMMVVIRIVVSAPVPVVVVGIITDIPVPVVPRVVGIAPHRVIEGISTVAPSVVPWRGVYAKGYVCSAPRSEHRGDILGLHPHLVARHHNVVVGWVVGSDIVYRATIHHIVVA